jgi:hypothetical protein
MDTLVGRNYRFLDWHVPLALAETPIEEVKLNIIAPVPGIVTAISIIFEKHKSAHHLP